jgi:tetratricopeptide (TPR) repeat protein
MPLQIAPQLLSRPWARLKGTSLYAAIAGIVLLSSSSTAQDKGHKPLIDARAAIQQMGANDPEIKIENAENTFNQHLTLFSAQSSKMPPHEAATQWLALVDEAIAIPHRSLNGSLGGSPPIPIGTLNTVLITLPEPQVWPEIQTLIQKRPPSIDRTALEILMARLLGDNEAVIRLCDEYDRETPKQSTFSYMSSPAFSIRLAALRRLGKLLEPQYVEQILLSRGPGEVLPSVIDLLPPDSAQTAMLSYLKQNNSPYELTNPQNVKLAQEVVIAHLSELPTPQWTLARDWNDSAYVKGLVEHYGYASLVKPNSNNTTQQQIYFRDLVLNGKLDEAANLIKDADSIPSLAPEDWGPEVKNPDQFIAALQVRVPKKDLWPLYVSAAVAAGHVPEALGRLDAQVSDPSTSDEQKSNLLDLRVGLHKRMGDLKGLATDYDDAKRIPSLPNSRDPVSDVLGATLAAGDEALIDKGIAHEIATDGWYSTNLLKALSLRGRVVDFERLQLEQLQKADASVQSQGSIAETLCAVYYLANKPEEIVSLLKEFPNWNQGDVSRLNQSSWDANRYEDETDQPVGFYIAWAFSKTGQKELAVQTLRAALIRHMDTSWPYRLLNEIGDASTLQIYEETIRAHPFDGWPVLWKGDCLFRLGRILEAEVCAREALAIDPTGTFGYREKLHGLLGQLLQKRGDDEGAQQQTRIDEAVRLASHAADLEAAGVLATATDVMKHAVAVWPEDAALQAQLAEYLRVQCLSAEAQPHYAKAYELLPLVLGQNSDGTSDINTMLYRHPLGDRGVEILDKAVAQNPNNAEAHYARGLLNSRLGYSKRAVLDFQKAVQIDPHHLGAWQQLSAIARLGLLDPVEAQNAGLQVIELSPIADLMQGTLDLSSITDLGKAYHLIGRNFQALPTVGEKPLFPLHTYDNRPDHPSWPGLDPLQKTGRLVGGHFRYSLDIRQISDLYHVTGFPFE